MIIFLNIYISGKSINDELVSVWMLEDKFYGCRLPEHLSCNRDSDHCPKLKKTPPSGVALCMRQPLVL